MIIYTLLIVIVGINSDDGDDELAAEIAAAHASDPCGSGSGRARERMPDSAAADKVVGGGGRGQSMRARGSGDGRR